MKDEVKGKIISEFVGLKVGSSEEIKKAKEVNKSVVENTRHKEFVDFLFNKKIMRQKWKEFK